VRPDFGYRHGPIHRFGPTGQSKPCGQRHQRREAQRQECVAAREDHALETIRVDDVVGNFDALDEDLCNEAENQQREAGVVAEAVDTAS